MIVGAGVGTAVVLLGGEDSDDGGPTTTAQETVPSTESPVTQTGEGTTTTPTTGAPTQRVVGAVEAGRYVQAGSFRTVAGAETEQARLAAAGIPVTVVDSDAAQDLFPGFQVLLSGPFTSSSEEEQMLKRVKGEVPSAFARDLAPALEISGPGDVAGEWTGELERTGTVRSGLNDDLSAVLYAAPDGQTASLAFDGIDCEVDLSLVELTAFTLGYEQGSDCVGGGRWSLRPSGVELIATLLPPDTDVIVVGSLLRR
ncbi:MAG: SPOR domain-containing protein [Solirubrobacterales bacterium]